MISLFRQHKLIVLIALVVVIRVAFLIVFSDTLNFELPGNAIHGSEAYDEYAVNLLESGVYGRTAGEPDAAIPPMYSYALAIVYGLFGRGFMQIGLFHTLLDVGSVILLYEICRRLFRRSHLPDSDAPEWIGWWAGVFMAAYPYLVFQNMTLIDTPFWIFLLHAFVYLLVILRERDVLDGRTVIIATLAGLALGIGTMTRPITPPLALLAALWFLFRISFMQTVIRLGIVAVISMLCVVPWIVRNYGIYDAFVPMTTTSGANLWQGNSPYTVPVFRAGYDVQWTAPEVSAPRDTREADAERFQQVIDYWRDNPEKIPELLWVKFLVHWSIEIAPRYNPQFGEQFTLDDDGNLLIVQADESIDGVTEANVAYDSGLMNTIGRPLHIIYFGGLLLLAIIGVILSFKQWRDVSLLWFVQISMTVIYVFFHPSTRYRAPSDPLLFAFSAYALVMLWLWFRQRRNHATLR